MFEVGDVLICIDPNSGARPGWHPPWQLEKEKMYRCNGIFNDPVWGWCVTLEGVDADTINNAFLASRFRKLPPAEPEFINLIRGLNAPIKIREDA
jgi:hypothetical protein